MTENPRTRFLRLVSEGPFAHSLPGHWLDPELLKCASVSLSVRFLLFSILSQNPKGRDRDQESTREYLCF